MSHAPQTAPVVLTVDVAADDPVFAGHYPGFPVLPGVYLIGYADQAVRASVGSALPPLSSVDSCRFHRPVYPGDRVTVTAELRHAADGTLACRAQAATAQGTVASLRLSYGAAREERR